MRRALSLAVLAVLLGTAPADAHRRGPIHNAQHLAVLVFGPNVCGDTMRVPIVKRELHDDSLGVAHFTAGSPRTNCRIEVSDWLWSDETCPVVLHELGHLAGWDHSTHPNAPPRSLEWLMWPVFRGPWAGCSSQRLPRYATSRP